MSIYRVKGAPQTDLTVTTVVCDETKLRSAGIALHLRNPLFGPGGHLTVRIRLAGAPLDTNIRRGDRESIGPLSPSEECPPKLGADVIGSTQPT